jgi:hypothetical protein
MVVWLDMRRLFPCRSRVMHPSISFFPVKPFYPFHHAAPYQPLPQDKPEEYPDDAKRPVRFYSVFSHSRPDSTRLVVRNTRVRTLLHFGFVIIAL